MSIDNWQTFLDRWSEQWVAVQDGADPEEIDEEALEAGGLGFPPLDEAGTAALEERLGTVLPPSYRAFLQASDGWRYAGGGVYLLAGSAGVWWHGDPMGMKLLYERQLDERSRPSEVLMAGMWDRALQLALDSDMTDVLLDPGDVGEDGEWAVYVYKGWSGEYPERYDSFTRYMEEAYRDFHGDHSHLPGFDNEETRRLDALVERARTACLAGEDPAAQFAAFDEARAYGRPGAALLHSQVEAMTRPAGHIPAERDLDDPFYAREAMPLIAAGHCRSHRAGDDDFFLRVHGEENREKAADLLEAVRKRTFRYDAPGPFGQAVASAREQARWGDTDGAWRTIAAAVPDWEPYGSLHLAPIGLRADPLLGPVVTAERGWRLLATPRAGHGAPGGGADGVPGGGPGDGAHGAPGGGPDGVSSAGDGPWGLGRPSEAQLAGHSYRFVAVQGIAPGELAERLGARELLAPSTAHEMWELRHEGYTATGRKHAVFRVGRCGGGGDWSFAFEQDPEPWRPGRVAADVQVSAGTRAVAVWSERGPLVPGPGEAFPDVLRFSCAQDGRRTFVSTARGGAAETAGTPPEGIDAALFGPALFGSGPAGRPGDGRAGEGGPRLLREAEVRALDAAGAALGISLPWFALEHGRLHVGLGSSWFGPPEPGGPYPSSAFVRQRPGH
ncbi:SMI1/KNR4 family protein [Streptomyces nitrosporeus]|uniref:SMI1/KNR4 family protein n=1 Tax=Streptomyces nitrosporeus TaxID=28894 RepID=UPI0019BB8F69|nr:SMI1/KNR4 family protein [Streptomyces nitrosporeus]GGZ17186.1 cell wall assembly protein [Streptomyces nitrosporeus]